jgi:hypothetical protein
MTERVLAETFPVQDPMDMLAEEGLEVAQERLKALRFGWAGTPEWVAAGNESPRGRFVQEVADFLVALEHAIAQEKISPTELDVAKELKHLKLERLFGMSRPNVALVAVGKPQP